MVAVMVIFLAGTARAGPVQTFTDLDEHLGENSAEYLVSVVLDPARVTQVRTEALVLLCERGTATGLVRTIDAVRALILRWADEETRVKSEVYAIPAVIWEFLNKGAPRVAERLDSQTVLLDLYMQLLEAPLARFYHIRRACHQRIGDNPADLAVRQSYVIRVIEAHPENPAPEVFLELMNADLVSPLRRTAFGASVGPRGYNAGALDLLAEFGDIETARRIKAWAKEQGYDEGSISHVGGYLWKIEAHHDPELLLEHLRSGEWIDHGTRPWALRKCLRVGVDSQRIRSALVEHGAKVGRDKRLLRDLTELKRMGKTRGVLRADDLPDIPDQPPTNVGRRP